MANPSLAVVIPVFNEEENIPALIRDWTPVFLKTGTPYRIMLIDDGSKDNSLALLRTLEENDPALSVHTQPNMGHGPAILRGYRMAIGAEWVFQIDADHQFDEAAFARLWNNRSNYDLLIAERQQKKASFPRQCISLISMLIVHILFGRKIRDVNSPYRLMRSELLNEALQGIKQGSFAPNILLTSWFVREKKRIFTTTVIHRENGIFRPSKMSLHFLAGSLQAAWETIIFSIRR